jgi:hypothetical protein
VSYALRALLLPSPVGTQVPWRRAGLPSACPGRLLLLCQCSSSPMPRAPPCRRSLLDHGVDSHRAPSSPSRSSSLISSSRCPCPFPSSANSSASSSSAPWRAPLLPLPRLPARPLIFLCSISSSSVFPVHPSSPLCSPMAISPWIPPCSRLSLSGLCAAPWLGFCSAAHPPCHGRELLPVSPGRRSVSSSSRAFRSPCARSRELPCLPWPTYGFVFAEAPCALGLKFLCARSTAPIASSSLPRLPGVWPTPIHVRSYRHRRVVAGDSFTCPSTSRAESSPMLTRPCSSLPCRVVIISCHELDPRCHRASHVLAFVVELLNPSSLARDFVIVSRVQLYIRHPPVLSSNLSSPARLPSKPPDPRPARRRL